MSLRTSLCRLSVCLLAVGLASCWNAKMDEKPAEGTQKAAADPNAKKEENMKAADPAKSTSPAASGTQAPVPPAPAPAAQPAPAPAAGGDEYAVLTLNVGDVVIDLFEEDTPKHAANFKKLVKEGFYNGLTFHRVIDGFMAQGGDPDGTGMGGPGYVIPAEIKKLHLRGSLAAARTGNPEKNSSGSQFYICFAPQPNLDRLGYTVFGQVVQGMEVVDKIQRGDPLQNGAVPLGTRSKIISAKLVPASSVK